MSWPEGPRPRVVPARPRRRLHRPARQRPARPADRAGLRARLRLQLRQPRRGARRHGSPAGSPPPARRSRSRRCAAPRRTARAGTSRAASTTGGSCCARPRRRWRRTPARSPTSTGTGSARPTTCGSTSRAMKQALDLRDGILGLPLIRNVKNVDPGDKSTPEVIQIETAMGAAIEVFEGSRADRGRPRPVRAGEDDQRPARAALGRLRDRPGLRARPGAPRCPSSTSTRSTTSWSASSTSTSPRARRR